MGKLGKRLVLEFLSCISDEFLKSPIGSEHLPLFVDERYTDGSKLKHCTKSLFTLPQSLFCLLMLSQIATNRQDGFYRAISREFWKKKGLIIIPPLRREVTELMLIGLTSLENPLDGWLPQRYEFLWHTQFPMSFPDKLLS